MKSEKVLADQDASQAEKSLVDVVPTFIANPQATELMQPAGGAFHHPTVLAQPAAMRRVPLGQDRFNVQARQHPPERLQIIPLVALQVLGTPTRTADFAPQRGNRFDQRQELSDIIRVGTGQDRRERDAPCIRDQVTFVAGLGFIRGIRACFFPPCTARTEALSTTARDQSIWSAPCSWARSSSCRACQRPAACQSRSRRQHVMPEPQPISCGKYSQGMPVLRTKIISVSA